MVNGPSGYADEARSYLRVLERGGHAPVARHLFGPAADPGLPAAHRAMLELQLDRPLPQAGVAVHHYPPSSLRREASLEQAANVARTMFETDRFPKAWLGQLLKRDAVWVPCEHNREAFERGGVPSNRLRVLPETIDFDVFAPGVEPLDLGLPTGHFVFVSNFDFSERKGWRTLLAAWARTFAPTDPACLVLKTGPDRDGRLAAHLQAALRQAARDAGRQATAPVQLLARTSTVLECARIYAAADAYVLASRGEGWGRPYMEALAMGLPTIASRWSGPLDFMRDETSWLVDGELVAVPPDNGVFVDDVSGHRWFDPDVDALGAALAEVASDPAASRRRAAPARADLLARFGPDVILGHLRERIDEVVQHTHRLDGGVRQFTLRGEFGRNSSLSIVNDHLVREFEAAGQRVHCQPLGPRRHFAQRPAVSHSWPPDFDAAELGAHVMILPWEFGHPPEAWVKRIADDVDRVVVPSEYVRQGYIAGGVPAGTVDVVPNGVDLDIFTPEGAAYELGVDAGCVFLFVGGTIWRKGIDLLVKAWERAFRAGDDVVLLIKDFGVGSHYRGQTGGESLRNWAARTDLAPVRYLEDEFPPEAMPALYRAADVLVAPYRAEGFCMPVLEAMACGLPAIHTATGPTREFVGDGGWPVPAKRRDLEGHVGGMPLAGPGYVQEVDVSALVAALRAARDPAERARRGAVAQARARAYSWADAQRGLQRSLESLERERLPLARTIQPAQVESRGQLVLYAPSWEDEQRWSAVLASWLWAVPAHAQATLVMPVLPEAAEDTMERVVSAIATAGFSLDALPDLVLHQTPGGDLAPLVAGADVVLLDGGQAAASPPHLRRRARRLVVADSPEFADFVSEFDVHPVTAARAA